MTHVLVGARLWAILAVILLLLSTPRSARAASVEYSVHWLKRMRVHVVRVDLTDRTIAVRPAIAYDSPGRRESFLGFLAEHQPLAAITGSYFSLDNSLPIGSVVIDRQIRYIGQLGSALAIRPDNRAEIVNIPAGWRYSWPGYEYVLQGGVRLLEGGAYAVYPRDQGFHDPVLFQHATRTAVGLTSDHHLLLVAVNKMIYLSDLAAVMKALGCRDAMSLDGGNSTGLAVGGNCILLPNRTLPTILMVTRRPRAE